VLWQSSVNIPETLAGREIVSNCLNRDCTFDLAIPISRKTDWNASDIIAKVDGVIISSDKVNLTRYGEGKDSLEFALVRLVETKNGQRVYEMTGKAIKIIITG
jgi:hypothetical protein